ncbi:hypothetical protein IE81DRAFT_368444 [Ceraceosorus guamensis]|uniref:Uncharacterized protein n=1 Tax=Ceraceosorus guamensis TaxID=1522189 RepID=A0A316VRF1_9BASI|nr:hypothetical protein IE81DRAFT_368444 [Ceraceosorus guamensis]PWN40239.1 hypothetical protein IE81DRAFT_368444 [Ceraceosorus guamensis]
MRCSVPLLVFGALALASLASAKPVKLGVITELVNFGDSLTDNGNGSYLLTNKTWPADPAYFNGRFSNGPTYVEYLARSLFSRSPSGPITDQGLRDLSYGGATIDNTRVQGYTGPKSTIPVPDVFAQIDTYLSSKRGSIHISNAKKLFLVSGGLNDIFFAIGTPIFESPEKFAEGSAKRLMQAVEALRKAGAIHFIIPYGPKLDALPYTSASSPSVQASFSAYSKALHLALQKRAKAYLRAHPLLRIVLFDGDVDSTLGGGDAFKVTDKPCLVGAYGEAPRSLCAEPDQHLFWDLYHPTTRAHSFLAQKAFMAIKRAGLHSIPSPAAFRTSANDEPTFQIGISRQVHI